MSKNRGVIEQMNNHTRKLKRLVISSVYGKEETPLVACPCCGGSGRTHPSVILDIGVLVGLVESFKRHPGIKLAVDPTPHLIGLWKRLKHPLGRRSRVNGGQS